MLMPKVHMEEAVMIPAAAFMVVNVHERRLKKSKHQRHVHQDGNGKPHTPIVQSQCALSVVR